MPNDLRKARKKFMEDEFLKQIQKEVGDLGGKAKQKEEQRRKLLGVNHAFWEQENHLFSRIDNLKSKNNHLTNENQFLKQQLKEANKQRSEEVNRNRYLYRLTQSKPQSESQSKNLTESKDPSNPSFFRSVLKPFFGKVLDSIFTVSVNVSERSLASPPSEAKEQHRYDKRREKDQAKR